MAGRGAILAVALLLAAPWIGRAETDDNSVVFVAWNVRNYILQPAVTEVADTSSRPPKTPESVAAVVQNLVALRPDILGLCEIGSRKDLADLQRRLKKSGLDLPHSTWVDGPDRERHLALLSRFPLASVQHDTRTTFTLDGSPRRVQRGILDVTIATAPDLSLRVLGVHLKSRRVVPEFDQAQYRREESMVLRSRLDDILEDNSAAPLLVFGDFNDTKNSPVVRGILGRAGSSKSLTLLPLADDAGDQWTYHWEESDEYSRVDFVMVNRPLLTMVDMDRSRVHRELSWRTASDHRPLIVTLRLPKK